MPTINRGSSSVEVPSSQVWLKLTPRVSLGSQFGATAIRHVRDATEAGVCDIWSGGREWGVLVFTSSFKTV